MPNPSSVSRCFGDQDPLMSAYHDKEWGVPVHGDRQLFEKLMLDAFQAGLSWRVILHKRESFREAFDDFDPESVAAFGPDDVARLMADEGIVRNRAKIEAAVANARACLELQQAEGSLDDFLWSFTGGVPLAGVKASKWQDKPTQSPESQAMSRALKERGFKFVGPTVCYAFMQAVGMIDDHLATCFKYSGVDG
jgi:DNA-3-methyladenine glycosylase I